MSSRFVTNFPSEHDGRPLVVVTMDRASKLGLVGVPLVVDESKLFDMIHGSLCAQLDAIGAIIPIRGDVSALSRLSGAARNIAQAARLAIGERTECPVGFYQLRGLAKALASWEWGEP